MKAFKEKEATSLTVTEGLNVTIIPDSNHEFLMSSSEVALGYGVCESNIREHRKKNSAEFSKDKHFLVGVRITDSDPHNKVYWTKRGIVRLGFFVRSGRARLFRDWAEDLVINKIEQKEADNRRLEALEKNMLSLTGNMFNLTGAVTDLAKSIAAGSSAQAKPEPKPEPDLHHESKEHSTEEDFIDARFQPHSFTEINGKSVRTIKLNNTVWYHVGDLLSTSGVRKRAKNSVLALKPEMRCKISIFGSTNSAWFCNKTGVQLLLNRYKYYIQRKRERGQL